MQKAVMLGKKHAGQGIIEFAGAMVVATLIVTTIMLGAKPGSWVYNGYQNLFDLSGDFLLERQQSVM